MKRILLTASLLFLPAVAQAQYADINVLMDDTNKCYDDMRVGDGSESALQLCREIKSAWQNLRVELEKDPAGNRESLNMIYSTLLIPVGSEMLYFINRDNLTGACGSIEEYVSLADKYIMGLTPSFDGRVQKAADMRSMAQTCSEL